MGTRTLVVGGTAGIGYGLACRIAAANSSSSVIISGRSEPDKLPHPNIEFRPLDASSMCQIKRYTDAFKSAEEQKLDFLIMSQAIMTTASRTETPEGIDYKMALHYFGKQLLIRELLPVLQPNAKIIIVLDGRLGDHTKLNWDDLDLKNHFSLSNAAQHCMVMNDAMIQYHATQQLQPQHGTGKRHFMHVFPGAVKTNIWKGLPWYLQPLMRGAGAALGADPQVYAQKLLDSAAICATESEAEGRFWSNIDNKHRLIRDKNVFTEAEMAKIAAHTWSIVDTAIRNTS
ncbi:uncharacterized protein HMPREF1541_07038 [Cyphellophora europaea CBS 101466]|uniref:Uncharacterized protein n=1 Tax=Cyphellophora europaea (strain CBS 101466) TaxID=1220924 RepID=W2RR61_CYPE1|nr:uncharacterized protein HMPREF1541_07038 [Cyphellophora europaea CBS 101466]ETN38996.1 hypothetical protein HMPREF1541_07038 [Cyphellophora europaea CBS 101466]